MSKPPFYLHNLTSPASTRPCPVPDAVEDVSVGVNPQHDVLHRGVVDEGALGVDKEDVRDPNLLHEPGVKRPALIVSGRKRQPLVFPVVTQVESHGEVLQDAKK